MTHIEIQLAIFMITLSAIVLNIVFAGKENLVESYIVYLKRSTL